MPNLPEKKVGIVACSGEEMAEGFVSDFVQANGLPTPHGLRRLDADGQQVVATLATAVADKVDELLAVRWSRRQGEVIDLAPAPRVTSEAACACGSGIPVTSIAVDGQTVQFMALTAIFDQAYAQGQRASDGVSPQLMEMVQLYNPLPPGQETLYTAALNWAWTEYGASHHSCSQFVDDYSFIRRKPHANPNQSPRPRLQ